MSYIKLIEQGEATGSLAHSYQKVVDVFTKAYADLQPDGFEVPVLPDVIKASSQVPAYCAYTTRQLELMTDGGDNFMGSPDAQVPRLLPCFITAHSSACFHCTEGSAWEVSYLVYGDDPSIARQIVEDYEKAPIPETHKECIRWLKKYVQCSWEMSRGDIERAHAVGVEDADIVDWAQMAAIQTWYAVQADAAGISMPLTNGAVAGPVIGRTRDDYHATPEGLTAGNPGTGIPTRSRDNSDIAWISVDTTSQRYRSAAERAEKRWGFVPNLVKAMSVGRSPDLTPATLQLLELLERPQSSSLQARQHAMIRALVSALNRSEYSIATIRRQLKNDSLIGILQGDYTAHQWTPTDRLILDFTAKVARNAYKITKKDAERFRENGIGEAAYIDVYCTVAAQLCVDRMTNALGVKPDEEAILAKE